MNLIVNGKPEQIEQDCSLARLVHHLNLSDDGIAVAVNRQVIPRSQRSFFRLSEDDEVEIVQAVGGG